MVFNIENGVLVEYIAEDGVTEVVIPEGVTEIGTCAFYECKDLTSVIFPESVTKIGDHAFDGCGKLTNVTLPGNITEIGFRAFNDDNMRVTVYGVTIDSNVHPFYLDDEKLMKEDDYDHLGIIVNYWDDIFLPICDKPHTELTEYPTPLIVFMGYAVKTGNEEALALLSEDSVRALHILNCFQHMYLFPALLDTGKFVTADNIDELIAFSIKEELIEVQTMLLHYKSEVLGYGDPMKMFEL